MADAGSCGTDQAGAPPDCTDCGRHRVPNAAGTACGACPEGQEEGFPGQCMPVGNCTRLGSYWPDAERGCVRAGLVGANAQCSSTCRANSADNGWGVCVCNPGYVYTVPTGALSGPTNCVERTDELCGAASDPGTCGPGGTWNSGTARCDCGDGYERSGDGRSCECATDDAEQTGYVASVLFPNPQSLFDGLRVGFVNTSSGNLTFRRRDIVTRAQGPAVFARVHDSRIAGNADFGPGWRLSLAEELLVDGDAATYVDESGARHAFAWTGTTWVQSPPTPRHAATTLAFADAGGIRIAVLADGDAVRTFEQADAAGVRYVVRRVRTPARELVLDYDGGRLAAVSHDGATLFEVERDRDGRIAALRDDHGRSVRYAYDADGRLETVRDIAGSDWRYRYRDDGLLGGAVDPEGRTYLAADHDAAGRVERAFADGRLHDYAYAPEGTTVADATGEVHALTRNAAGATTALSSTTGDSWSLALDAANRVSTLTLPARTIGYAYGGHGKVATMTVADSVSGTTRMRSYDYDGQGRLVAVSGGGADATATYASGLVRIDDGGGVFEYEVDDRGRVARVQRGAEPEIRVERDQAGDVVEISQGHRSVRFGRDDLGRIVDAAFPDGSSARYFYDELGNRTLSQFGDRRSVTYEYDAAGGLASVKSTERDGTVRVGTVSPRADLVERIEHGLAGRWGVFDAGQKSLPVDNPVSRALALTSGESSWFDSRGHTDVQRLTDVASDNRLAVLMGDSGSRHHADHGVLSFGRRLETGSRNPDNSRVPQLADARALLAEAQRLFRGGVDRQFDETSNAVFRSALLRGDGFTRAASPDCEPEPVKVCRAVSDLSGFDDCDAGVEQGVDPNASTDGCSTPVPTGFEALFTPSCNVHDICYNTCQSGRGSCDGAFYAGLLAACAALAPLLRPACNIEASAYYTAVASFGAPNYETAQIAHCDCCSWESP